MLIYCGRFLYNRVLCFVCVLHDGKDAGLYVVVVVVEYARRRHLSTVMMQLMMERKESSARVSAIAIQQPHGVRTVHFSTPLYTTPATSYSFHQS